MGAFACGSGLRRTRPRRCLARIPPPTPAQEVLDDGPQQVTRLELAAHRLGRDARTQANFDQAGVPISAWGATVAAYNAHPSRSDYIRCAQCIGEHGWTAVALADHDE